MNIQLGDGIALIQMALPFVKSAAPKILGIYNIIIIFTINMMIY